MPDLPYSAFRLPGAADDFDPNEAVRLGAQWLDRTQGTTPHGPLVVVNAASMTGYARLRPLHGQTFLSPASRRLPRTEGHAVLAVWPSQRALEFAERFARDGALCVVPGHGYDAADWMARVHARDLTDPDSPPSALEALDPAVRSAVDYLVQFAGYNNFVGGDDKRTVVVQLRELKAAGHELDGALIAAHALASGETDNEGARRLREFVDGVNAGRSYRDRSGLI